MHVSARSPELVADADLINVVLGNMVRRSPCGLVDALVWEDASSNHQLVEGAQVCKMLAILIHLAQSVSPHGVLVASVVRADLAVIISREDGHDFGSSFVYLSLELLVEVVFLLLFRIIDGSVVLNDVQRDVFLLGGGLGCDDTRVDRFTAGESTLCLWCQHQGHSFSVGGSILFVTNIQHLLSR